MEPKLRPRMMMEAANSRWQADAIDLLAE